VSNDLPRLAIRIRESFAELDLLMRRIEEGWQRYLSSGDDFYLDGVALNLHGLYSGLERIFELVAEVIDGVKPVGENWHQVLLKQMADEVPGVRPAVISVDAFHKLNEYRGFRHVVRNVYTFKFDPDKIGRLVNEAPEMLRQVNSELMAFADFLELNASR
jgi:hypothetical protein